MRERQLQINGGRIVVAVAELPSCRASELLNFFKKERNKC